MVLLWCGFCRLRERERESRLKILQALLLKAHTSAKLQKSLNEREKASLTWTVIYQSVKKAFLSIQKPKYSLNYRHQCNRTHTATPPAPLSLSL